jgi:hypothetical protein
VLADDVEQAGEAIARLRQLRVGPPALGDVRDDAAHQQPAVDPANGARAVAQEAGDAVDAQHPVCHVAVLAVQEAADHGSVKGPVVGMDA